MRAVVVTGPNEVELNFMWLPTIIGMNRAMLQDLEIAIAPLFEGQLLTDDVLNKAHDLIVKTIAEKFPVLTGLDAYLDGLKYVEGP